MRVCWLRRWDRRMGRLPLLLAPRLLLLALLLRLAVLRLLAFQLALIHLCLSLALLLLLLVPLAAAFLLGHKPHHLNRPVPKAQRRQLCKQ